MHSCDSFSLDFAATCCLQNYYLLFSFFFIHPVCNLFVYLPMYYSVIGFQTSGIAVTSCCYGQSLNRFRLQKVYAAHPSSCFICYMLVALMNLFHIRSPGGCVSEWLQTNNSGAAPEMSASVCTIKMTPCLDG